LYAVKFVNKKVNGITTLTNSTTYSIPAKNVILPNIQMGIKSPSEDALINDASKFSSKDTGIQCNLVNYTFIDTTALFYSIKKESDTSEELVGNTKIHVRPYSNFSKTINMHEFSNAYGKGKFHLEILDHNQIVATKNFEIQ